MMQNHNLEQLKSSYNALSGKPLDTQLLILKNECLKFDGFWEPRIDLQDSTSEYLPVLYELKLHGVSASSDNRDMLPLNWMRAVKNILEALPAHQKSSNNSGICPALNKDGRFKYE